jgi:YidC/Oxa1 family membrane protein insertase
MDDQQKNMMLAVALSFLVILVWSIFFTPPLEPLPDGSATSSIATPQAAAEAVPVIVQTPEQTRAAALTKSARVTIETPSLSGSINLTGGRIDDLHLKTYRETIDPGSEVVTLLSPAGAPQAYYALHGWAPAGGLPADQVPGAATPWQLESGGTLSPGKPLVLVWDNGSGLTFRKTIAVDDRFMFTVTQSVTNGGAAAVRMFPYGIVARNGLPADHKNFFVLHEGMISAADGVNDEVTYANMADLDANPDEGGLAQTVEAAENGWIGLTDHYWMTVMAARPGQPFTQVTKFVEQGELYQTDMRLGVVEIAPGATASAETYLYAGAKEYEAIRDYQASLGIDRFTNAIDWGWFYFLTKPIFIVLHWMNQMIGNMGLAIIGLTLVIKTLLFPLAWKSYVSMSKMKALQPEMEKIKERAGDDRQKLQQEMMALYRKEKVNPASGCLPILVQIPIFFSLYKVIFVTLDLRHAPFFGWLKDLSAPDPTSILNLFGLLPWDAPGPGSLFFLFSIGVLPILLGISMWLQQKLNPEPTDPTQAAIFAWMPWIFMFMLGTFASGLVIYWIANNMITFTQQYLIMRSQGVRPDVFGRIMSSFRRRKKAT